MSKFTPPTDPRELARLLLRKGGLKSPGFASELARGLKTPSYDMALQLEDRLGVPPRYWRDLKDQNAAKPQEAA